MRVTVIFDNLGPYHLARLRSSAGVCDLTAIQVSDVSVDYAWKTVGHSEDFPVITLFPTKPSGDISARAMQQRVSLVMNDIRPEIVFIPGWSSRVAFAVLDWCLKQRVPAVVMSESTAWDERRSWWKEWIKARLITLISGALVGGTPHRDYMVQLGMPPGRIELGYDAVDNDYFRQGAEKIRRKTSETGNQSSPVNYFLASNRFIEKKNLFRLLEAYARYRIASAQLQAKSHPRVLPVPWSLVLLGDGPLREVLRAQISSLNLQNHVLLPGFIQYPDLPAHYALAGAFIHASTTEQWGLVVNEAMASGLPILVSNRCGCVSTLVREGRNGFAFDPFDSEELAVLMQRVSSMTPGEIKAMGTESERIIAEWGSGRFSKGLSDLTQKVSAAAVSRPGWLARLILRGLLLR